MSNRNFLASFLVPALSVLALAACAPTLSHPSREANRTVPSAFVSGTSGGATSDENSAAVDWREFFEDPKLQALIEAGLENNQELKLLTQEIEISRYEVMARRGEYLPKVAAGASLGIEKVGEHTSQGASDEATGLPVHLQDYRLGVVASWEVDIWKKLRNATKAATLRYLSSVEGKKFMVTVLVAEIADSYYELGALDSQLVVLKENLAILEDTLGIVRLQKEAGRVTELAVQRFEAEMFENQSTQFAISQQIVEAENRINLLVGRYPQPVSRSTGELTSLVPKAIAVGMPADLLENRPDVRRAELELKAAKLDVRVAKARFYPSMEIKAGVGYHSYEVLKLLSTPASTLYDLGADLVAPLFNRNELKANYYSANAKQMQAVLSYERTLLTAYIEALNEISKIDNIGHSYELREKATKTLQLSVETSTGLFNAARAEYTEVLLTRRDALESQMELIEMKKEQLVASVHLYRALGGGWQ